MPVATGSTRNEPRFDASRHGVNPERVLDELRARIESWEKLSSGSAAHREFAQRKLDELDQYRRELEADLHQHNATTAWRDRANAFNLHDIQQAWARLITQGGPAMTNYLHLLIERIEICGDRIDIIAREHS